MYLKKIEMRGFKTFADRTELEFGPGITAIVGPNGVGKSNIADAVLWSLGEQSYRALRTEASQDVIFAGSERRRPLGMAEVTLTVDNSDGELPVEFSEIAVCRRLFRSGESEYLLNRATARLRDIREAFLDTGAGPGAYSVVGQGEIDAILSIRSEDRRELLEEVAGIRKYRVRRDEATRKLEATEANMTRVADIVAELASQREPLEKQAQVAHRYQELSERLRELELHVLASDYRRRHHRIGRLANDLAITKADLQATRDQLSRLDAEYEKVQLELLRAGDELERLRDEAAAAERALDQATQSQALAQERLRAAVARQHDLAAMLETHRQRLQDAEQHVQEAAREHTVVSAELRLAEEQRSALEADLAARAGALEAQQQRLAALSAQRAELAERATALENEALALQSLENHLAERSARLYRQSEALAAREEQLEQELLAGQQRVRALEQELESHRRELNDLRQTLVRSSRTLQEHRQKCNLFSGAVTHAEARQELLRELEQAHEGFGEGPKAAMRAAAEGQLTGVVGLVAELLQVPARYERAVEAALGGALQWVVVESEEQAVQGAMLMRSAGAGRVTFVPLSVAAQALAPAPLVSPSAPGVIGPVLKLVRYAREHERLLTRLLGDTVVVKDLETALGCHQRLRGRVRLVTLAGELVGADGAVTVGGEEGTGAHAFMRRRELEELTAELDVMRVHLARMWKREEGLDQWCRKLTEEIHGVEGRLAELQAAHVSAAAELTHLADQQKAARQTRAELLEEAEVLSARLAEARSRREAAEQESQTLRQQESAVAAQIERANAEGIAQAEVEQVRAAHVGAQVRVAELAEKERAWQHLMERYAADLTWTRQEMAAAQQELQSAQETEARLREELEAPGVDLAELRAAAEAQRQAATAAAGRLAELRQRSAELDSHRSRLSQVAQEQTDRIHRAELGLTREEAQLETIAERLQDAYDVTPEQAMGDRDECLDERQVREEANALREQIRALGPVNLSSIDECERLRAREDFLRAQLGDLQAAREDLLQVIREIDEAATAEFMSAFSRVQTEFQAMFERLFGGGKTELRLTQPEKPLEAGVDVVVQVPGKRQQNLVLLSGGERALTALALLFAMLRVKPTPFCVLDEIDAALDESNTDRFTQILQEFARSSQFIIITHNPHTIQVADVLFGITMAEPGVSSVIKLEMRQWEEFMSEAEEQVAARTPKAGTRVLPVAT